MIYRQIDRKRERALRVIYIVGVKSYFSPLGMKSREEKLLFTPWDEKQGCRVKYGDYKGSKFAQNGIKGCGGF